MTQIRTSPSAERLKEEILDCGAIIYVPVGKEDGFYVIKVPGEPIAWTYEDFISSKKRGGHFINFDIGVVPNGVPRCNCLILDEEKLYDRLSDESIVQHIFDKYGNVIATAPEFSIPAFFTSVFKRGPVSRPGTAVDGLICSQFDYLMPKENVKLSAFPTWIHVRRLLIRAGLIRENRGKEKSIDATTKKLRVFILKEFKSIKRKKPLPLKILKGRLDAEVNRIFPDDEKKAQKYYWSETTIRRLIESSIKK